MTVSVTQHGAEGFVRVPRRFLTLPVSPGAKVLLMHLCAAANDTGESWHSYAGIAAMLGRSKASVSSYVAELVAEGVIDSIRQTTANGYNHRRRLRVRHWPAFQATWKALTAQKQGAARGAENVDRAPSDLRDTCHTSHEPRLSGPPASSSPAPSTPCPPAATQRGRSAGAPAECRVQQTECKDPSGPNKNHGNKTAPAAPQRADRHAPETCKVRDLDTELPWTPHDERAWRAYRPSDTDPPTVTRGTPDPAWRGRLEASCAVLERMLGHDETPDQAQTRRQDRLIAFARRHRLETRPESPEMAEAVEAVASHAPTQPEEDILLDRLEAAWQPHWRRLSSASQIARAAQDIATALPEDMRRMRSRLTLLRMRIWILDLHAKRMQMRQASRAA